MIRRLLTSGLLSLCLFLTGLAATVAETRMAAAGGFCGAGHPEILLDEAGLPLLDADGSAIAAPDCPLCTLALSPPTPDMPSPEVPIRLIGRVSPLFPQTLHRFTGRLINPARAPPAMV